MLEDRFSGTKSSRLETKSEAKETMWFFGKTKKMDKFEGAVKLYTTSWCGFCRGALSFLEQNGVEFENVDLTDDSAKLQEMKNHHGHHTVPIVLIGDNLVGGFSELKAFAQQHGLEHLK